MNPRFDSVPRFGVASILALVFALVAGTGLADGQDDRGAALRAAASRGEVEAVRSLLAGGAGVDDANEYGATALILACMRGHADVVRVVLEAGADADLADGFYGLTPLGWAADNGHEEVISLLFASGAGGFDRLFFNAVDSADEQRVAELLAMHVPEADVLSAALQRVIETGNRPLGEVLIRFGAVPPPPEILDLDPEVLRRYAGVYVDEVGFELEVRADPDTGSLLVRSSGLRNSLRFLPVEETTFISEQSAAIFIRFTVREGRVVSMSFTQSGDTRRMTRR
ncbi:MAG: ankyrin repeat domain-containing protein [Acidobacteria bacterium]|nr:ankyrin repeat domain-containing protein [Acidobacteriota bacterium]